MRFIVRGVILTSLVLVAHSQGIYATDSTTSPVSDDGSVGPLYEADEDVNSFGSLVKEAEAFLNLRLKPVIEYVRANTPSVNVDKYYDQDAGDRNIAIVTQMEKTFVHYKLVTESAAKLATTMNERGFNEIFDRKNLNRCTQEICDMLTLDARPSPYYKQLTRWQDYLDKLYPDLVWSAVDYPIKQWDRKSLLIEAGIVRPVETNRLKR